MCYNVNMIKLNIKTRLEGIQDIAQGLPKAVFGKREYGDIDMTTIGKGPVKGGYFDSGHRQIVAAEKVKRGFGKLIKGYKKGGKVKKTGLALLHKGEVVLTKEQAENIVAKKFGKSKY